MKNLKFIIPIFVFLFFAQPVLAQNFVVPELTGPVMDLADMIDESTEKELRETLFKIYDEKKGQVQVLTVTELGGLSVEEAAIKIFDTWKLGDAARDDGLLLLVAKTERGVRIEVGDGLEGLIPDVEASQIIRNAIVPQFKMGRFGDGILLGVIAIENELRRTPPPPEPPSTPESRWNQKYQNSAGKYSFQVELVTFLIFFGVVCLFQTTASFMIWALFLSPRGGSGYSSGGSSGFRSSGFGSSRSSFSSSSSSRSWSGGGGRSSGGGASGRW